MRILYAVQKTGNGHLARAQEIIPILQIYGDVDILTSGSQSQINLGFPVKYDFKGISLFYGSNGNAGKSHYCLSEDSSGTDGWCPN